jgi:parvulin-like peptidyl-prolyl isomerase
LKTPDPNARREGAAKTPGEAEAKALQTLELLLAKPADFVKLCREISDCQTGGQPGQLVGHLGWVGRGEQEAAFEEVAFSLEAQEFGDIVTTSRGVHVIQRLG